jgi:hypothetical protein
MFNSERAIVFALAFMPWGTLTIMTVHAIIVHSSAVIGRDIAAKVALVLDVVSLVLCTVGYTVLIIRILAEEFAFLALVLLVKTSNHRSLLSL